MGRNYIRSFGFRVALLVVGLSACTDPNTTQDVFLRDAYSRNQILQPPEQLRTQLDYWREVGVDVASFEGILFVAAFEQQPEFAELSYQMWLTDQGLWGIVIEGDEVIVRSLKRDSVNPFESAYTSMYFKTEALGGLLQFQTLSKDVEDTKRDQQQMVEVFGQGTLEAEGRVYFWKPSTLGS
ncbi:MAG: hypothetical protein AAF662_16345 [Pseudomonadota bacterium]